jgi:uncharacterized protein (TIGR02271 family)
MANPNINTSGIEGTEQPGTQTKAGGVVGRVIDALTGRERTHRIDRDREDAYWRESFTKESGAQKGHRYEDYAPAYRTGYEGFSQYEPGTRFEDAEPTLQEDYAAAKPPVPWTEAREAARSAWSRVERGDAFTVPLSEEELAISKREIEAGTARIRKVVRTETVDQPVELRHEEAVVERVTPTTTEVPSDAFQEGTIEVPLKREEAVVEKTARVTGEVRVKKEEM